MPNIKSAEKRIILSEKQNMRNRQVISEIKTKTKTFQKAVEDGADNVNDLYRELTGLVDKAQQKGVIHQNKANRKKAQLSKMLSA